MPITPIKGKVMAFGTFDLLHLGHLGYLTRARGYGRSLVVIVTSDKWARREKGHRAHHTALERARLVSALKPVDRAIVGGKGDKLAIVLKERPSVIVLGHDQRARPREVRERLAERGLKVRVVRARAFSPRKFKGRRIVKALHRIISRL